LVQKSPSSTTKRENGKILEDIGPWEDGSVDAAILAQIIHEYNNN
jgi:hypothetical protein